MNRITQLDPASATGKTKQLFDGVQAKLAEAAGFDAVYMTGFGTAASHGLPDLGLIGRGEMSAKRRESRLR